MSNKNINDQIIDILSEEDPDEKLNILLNLVTSLISIQCSSINEFNKKISYSVIYIQTKTTKYF